MERAPRNLARNLWVINRPFKLSYVGVEIGTRMTCAPLGGLFLHSPVKLDPVLRNSLDALGEVRAIIAPNKLLGDRCALLCLEMPRSRACSRPRPDHAVGGRAGHEIRESESASPQQSARNSRSEVPRPRRPMRTGLGRCFTSSKSWRRAALTCSSTGSPWTRRPRWGDRESFCRSPHFAGRAAWRVLAQTGNYPQSESMRFRCRSPMCTPRSRSRSASSLPQSTFCRMRGPNRTGHAVTDGSWGSSSPLGDSKKRCPAPPRSNV